MTIDNLSPFIVFDSESKVDYRNGHKGLKRNLKDFEDEPDEPLGPNVDLTTLKSNRLLRGLPNQEIYDLLKTGELANFNQDQVISYQGTSATSVLFIMEGRARAEVSGHTNQKLKAVVNFIGPGDDVGLLSVIDGAPHSATVTSLEKVVALSVSIPTMRKYLVEHQEWYRYLTEMAVERLRINTVWLQALM